MDLASSLLLRTYNARDLGGLRAANGIIRSGQVLRSDVPIALGQKGRALVRRLGVRTAIDLREPVERELDPPDFAGLAIRVARQPILGGDLDPRAVGSLEQLYMSLIHTRGEHLAAAVGLLARERAMPALVFCSAGKDRTGLVTALLLAAVGVCEADIVADYQRTEYHLTGAFRAKLEARALAAGLGEQELAAKVDAPAPLMRHVLGWLRDHHGGAAGYLRAHGVSSRQLESLSRQLVQAHAGAS